MTQEWIYVKCFEQNIAIIIIIIIYYIIHYKYYVIISIVICGWWHTTQVLALSSPSMAKPGVCPFSAHVTRILQKLNRDS